MKDYIKERKPQMYHSIVRHILAPVFELSSGTKVMKCLKELDESQWWPRNKILELQNQRLRQLVRHAYDNVPYYRQLFEEKALKPNDIECSADIIKLPVLTKQIIKENFNSLIAVNVSSRQISKKYTSGSTGEPLMFYVEKKGITQSYASSQRAYGWSGYEIGDKSVFIGQRQEYHSVVEKTKERAKNFFERIKIINVQAMSMDELPFIVREIKDFHPEFIQGYPSVIYLLARFMEREGENKLNLKAIITIAEKVDDYQRDLFRKVFNCEAYSLYSATEAPNIAAECSSHRGYHVTAEHTIVEIVDNQGNPVPASKEGRILVTNLFNYAMPFLRYDIGDIGAMSDHVCACGRGLPLLMKLDGRISDSILTKNGRSIPGLVLHQHFLAHLEGVVQWQIVQENLEKVLVKLVLDRRYPKLHIDKLTSEIVDHYKPILGNDMLIIVEFVDQIPLTRTGKRRFIISKVICQP
jgi:phenylacetate-CoA ligase